MTTARRGWGLLRYVGLTPSSATQAPPPQRGHFYSVREGVISIGGQVSGNFDWRDLGGIGNLMVSPF